MHFTERSQHSLDLPYAVVCLSYTNYGHYYIKLRTALPKYTTDFIIPFKYLSKPSTLLEIMDSNG